MTTLSKEELEVIAMKLAHQAKEWGVRGVIVAVSSEEGEHSTYWITSRGPCIEVEGLSKRIESYVTDLWNGKVVRKS